MRSCCELNEDEELRLGFSDEWTPSADSAVARALRNPCTARTSAPRLQELPDDGPEPLGEKEALSRGEIRSAWSWLKKVILEENVKGVDIRLHSWREEERERDRESATLFRPEQMEWLDTGGKAIGYSFFSFPFFLHAFMTLEDLKSAIKSLICPGTWSGDPRKGVQYEEKKNKCRHSRPTSTTTLMNRLTFFQLNLNYSNATAAVVLRVLRSSICCTVS